MTAYATRRDVYKYGLPRGLLASSARLVESAVAATDVFTLDAHGFETGDAVVVRAEEGGSLPSPLVAGVTYFAIRESDSTFKLSATDGGAAINLTTSGTSVYVANDLPVDDVLEFYSRWVDDNIPHVAPLESPYPVVIVATVAELAAKKLLTLAGHASVNVSEFEEVAQRRLERWARGLPIRDANVTASANKAVVSSVSATGVDTRGWGSGAL